MSLQLLTREEIGGGMTLPLVLAIAIGGGVLLFICLAFLLIALAGRRHRARARAGSATPGVIEGESASDEGSQTHSPRPRRLTKPKPVVYTDMVEIQGQPHRSLSSLFNVPRSKTLSVSTTPAETASGQQRGGYLRRNNSWIDEDAIHGPRVQKGDRRLSVQDDFILRTPTLPELLIYKEDSDEQFCNDIASYYIQQPRPASLPAQRGQPPRLPLPRTASYELAERLAAAARGGVAPSQQGPRLVPPQRLRHKTTESDLAEILRSTEERLRDGTPSNSRPATRQRGTSASAGSSVQTPRGSPTKPNSPSKTQSLFKNISPTRSRPPSKTYSPGKEHPLSHVSQTVDTAALRARTPSPQKRANVPTSMQTPQRHKRNISQCSVVSDADSLFGETTRETDHMLQTELSSPSRRSDHDSPVNAIKLDDRCMSLESPASDASSSLSTLYSVNEPEDHEKAGGTGQSEENVRGRKARGLIIDTMMCDPFVIPGPPEVPPKSPKRQAASLPPLRRNSPVDEKPIIDAPFHSRSASSSPATRTLDLVKPSNVADGDETSYTLIMHSPSLDASPEVIRPQSVTSMKPVLLVASMSINSMKASPGSSPEDNNLREKPNKRLTFGQKSSIIPPLTLLPGEGSPNRETMVMSSPVGSFPIASQNSPTIRTVQHSGSGLASHSPSSPTRSVLPSPELRGDSNNQRSPTPRRYKKRGMASPIRERALPRQSNTSTDRRSNRIIPSSDCPSIVLKPSDTPKGNPRRDFA
ncbi:hypothetical protein CCHL11_04547 [Colletotrichum chlorophyti]|uniref:Uncharacterized protein n=1 Tax=Colletotrichum chlorophyti TaxID=708187 RepID=A0A1Q8RRF7_9PEZI|nr:hypothetical protein CCHL11_04547 [Colletotrichum chlorophyti]